jgi:hypothetical protein
MRSCLKKGSMKNSMGLFFCFKKENHSQNDSIDYYDKYSINGSTVARIIEEAKDNWLNTTQKNLKHTVYNSFGQGKKQ